MASNLQWVSFDENMDGSGNSNFNGDYSLVFILPGIKDANRNIIVYEVALYIKDDTGTWQTDKWSANVGGVSRWVSITIADFSSGAVRRDLTSASFPKRQREFFADAGYNRINPKFPDGSEDQILVWLSRLWSSGIGGKPQGVKMRAGKERLQSFFNNDFTALTEQRVSALIAYDEGRPA